MFVYGGIPRESFGSWRLTPDRFATIAKKRAVILVAEVKKRRNVRRTHLILCLR